MTKKQMGLYENYKRAWAQTLDDVYGRYSVAKAKAMDYCYNLQSELKGHDGRICSWNTFQFTYAFRYEEDGKQMLAYITANNDYYFQIEA